MTTAQAPPPHPSVPVSSGHRITHWDPEDEYFWENGGAKIARRNMVCSVITEHVGFAVWALWGSLLLFLGPEYGLSPEQKFLLVSIPAAVGGALRIPYSMAVAKFGGRDWTIISASLLLLPTIPAAFLIRPGVEFSTLLLLGALAGVGGGNFASSMSNINAFYPERKKGLALGINAAAGNAGVAAVQLIALAVLATVGAAHPRVLVGIFIPIVVVCSVIAALYMDNIVHQINDKGAVREASREPHTWIISLLYIGTFGSFIGFSFAFGQVLLVQFPEYFSKVVMVGEVAKTVPDPVKAAYLTFLGPLIGSVARPYGGWLADRRGGAVITFWSFVVMTGLAVLVLFASLNNSLPLFILGFVLLFVVSGLANGSCYKMIPVLFRGRAAAAIDSGVDPKLAMAHARRRTGAVIGIAGAIGAFGGLGVNIAFRQSFLTQKNGNAAYLLFIGFYVLCAIVTWAVYMRTRRGGAAAMPTVESIAAAKPAPAPSRPGLHGAVVAHAGPIAGAPITLLDERGAQVARTRANSAGSFHLTGVAPGRYLLVCSGVGMYRPTSIVVDLDAGGCTLEPFVLGEIAGDPADADSEVVGTVRDGIGPVAETLVTLLDRNGALCAATRTDRHGRFRVGPAPAGPSTLSVVAAGFAPTSDGLCLPPGVVRHDPALHLHLHEAAPAIESHESRDSSVPILVD